MPLDIVDDEWVLWKQRRRLTLIFLSAFKQLEIDYAIGESEKEWVPGRPGPAALLRMFGVTSKAHLGIYISFIDKNAQSKQEQQDSLFVTNIEMVHKRSLMYFQSQKARAFLKIVVALPTMVASCRGTTFSTKYNKIVSHSATSQYSKLASFRIRYSDCGSCDSTLKSWSAIRTCFNTQHAYAPKHFNRISRQNLIWWEYSNRKKINTMTKSTLILDLDGTLIAMS
ncbi:hypothetical protein SELMODRAFT_422091 [Selaginella moellendorffii]|uniref:Uncharacterized protein n=1 Tax=Selaginella moellendorffii TaxID=88036 RepID=D8SHB4_SELML|nr:hypothetical protein SELMODRAFT_422091 [Selaginella moellendorffii]